MKKSNNLLTSKSLFLMGLLALILSCFILAGSRQQHLSRIKSAQVNSTDQIEQQVTQAYVDQPNLEQHKLNLQSYCHLRPGECNDYLRHNLSSVINWKLQKILLLLEVVILSNSTDYGLVREILDYQLDQYGDEPSDHGDERMQTIAITKTVAIKLFNQKLAQGATSANENEMFKQDLLQMAHEEDDLMLVRNALMILKKSFYLERNEIRDLVADRGVQDLIAYQDLI